MAQHVDFPERNDFIGKPKNLTENQCDALPIARILTHIPGPTYQDPAVETTAHVSCWELSEEEREEVAKTGKVYLKVLGNSTYPVSLHGKLPIYINAGNCSDTLFTKGEIEEAKEKKRSETNN